MLAAAPGEVVIQARVASMKRRSELFAGLAVVSAIAGINCVAFLCSAGGYGVLLSLLAIVAIFVSRR